MKIDANRKIAVGKEILSITIYEGAVEPYDAICIVKNSRHPDVKYLESLEDVVFRIGDLEDELEQLRDQEEEDLD